MTDDLQDRLNSLAPLLVDGSPHAQALGLRLVGLSPGRATMSVDYREDLIGDPETQVLHGGVITALLDHVCGIAAFAGFDAQATPATLDLRLDYMRPAEPGRTVIAEAECIRAHGLVAFVRAIAHDGDSDDPVATAQAAFMITQASRAAEQRVKDAIETGEM